VERRDVVEEVTRVQQVYGHCLQALGEHRAAVKVFASAAARARDLPDQRLHASLTHDAGRALESSNLPVDAEQMYLRAAALWETAGDPAAAVRATRAAAWTLIDRAESRYDDALALLDRAATMSPDERPETLYQTVQLVMEWPEDVTADLALRGVTMADEAADGFRAAGAVERAIRAGLFAADLVGGPLDDVDGARARIAQTRERALATGDPRLIGMCDEAAQRWKP
jgi:tetratricopeptide (TPR) repeat protein